MLSTAEIAAMRSTMSSALPDLCTVERGTEVSDGGGGMTTEWVEHLVDVPCRISPIAGGEGGTPGARIADESSHIVTLAAGTDVTEADRLRINDDLYEVTLVRTRGEWELTCRVECKEAPDSSSPADGDEELVVV